MSATPLPVQSYLSYLEAYLKGDLDKFHGLCTAAELEEGQFPTLTGEAPFTQSEAPAANTTSSTTTNRSTGTPAQSSPDPNLPKIFRSTIPHALALFATIDIVGFFLSSHSDPAKTSKNFKTFLDRAGVDKVRREALVLLFRHGMAHGYFPKAGLAISYHTTNPKGQLFFKHNGNIALNANELESIVLNQLSSIQPANLPQMQKQYKIIENDYNQNCGQMIAKLSALL